MEGIDLLNYSSLINILTLRFDSTIKPNLPVKLPVDIQINNVPPQIDFLEKIICDEIRNKVNNSGSDEVSIALSGGVDSTLMLCLLRKVFPKIKINAISIKFADSFDETINAAKIAETFDAQHHIVEIKNYFEELPKAISIINKPFWDLHWYYVVKKSQKLGKILISGDGGDEIFGGYTFRYKNYLKQSTINTDLTNKISNYLSCHERDHVPDQEKIFGKKIQFSWQYIHNQLKPYFENELSLIDQVFLADFNGKLLYNFNPINNNISNYFGIEMFTPLLSKKIISLGLNLNSKFKYDEISNIGKLPLRKILENNNADHLVSDLKLGFNVNTVNLWKSFGYDLCIKYLENANIIKEEIISKDWITKYLKNSLDDVRYINKFYGLLSTEIWYKLFITKDMTPDVKLR